MKVQGKQTVEIDIDQNEIFKCIATREVTDIPALLQSVRANLLIQLTGWQTAFLKDGSWYRHDMQSFSSDLLGTYNGPMQLLRLATPEEIKIMEDLSNMIEYFKVKNDR